MITSYSSTPESATDEKMFQAARIPFTLPVLVFLGLEEASHFQAADVLNHHNPNGSPVFAIDVPTSVSLPSLPSNCSFQDARSAASHLSPFEAGLFAQARAMIDWNTRNKFCAACGRETYSLWAGWKRGCTSVLQHLESGQVCPSTKGLQNFQYPRTDPVS